MVNCENCKNILTKDDIKAGICLNSGCDFPITDTIQDEFLKEIGLEQKVPEQIKKPVSMDRKSYDCKKCGAPNSEKNYQNKVCEQCGLDPTEDNQPPIRNITPSKQEVNTQSQNKTSNDSSEHVSSKLNFISDRNEIPTPSVVSGNATFEVVIGNLMGKEFTLEQNINLGRENFFKVLTPDFAGHDYISSGGKHLKLSYFNNKLFIKDLGSTNGTQVNNERLIANVDHELKLNDRIIIGEGGFIFRLLKYSQLQTGNILNKYQLREEETRVIYPLDTNLSEIIGRNPLNNGNYHPFLFDVFSHRIQSGEDVEVLKIEIQSIGRIQFSLRFDKILDSWEITNLSSHGTTVNNQKLPGSGEKMVIKSGSVIEFGNKFKCTLQNNPKFPSF
jgi:pSer/pThr/pTyr-binding forkhead associated (FHA) protein